MCVLLHCSFIGEAAEPGKVYIKRDEKLYLSLCAMTAWQWVEPRRWSMMSRSMFTVACLFNFY